MRMNDDQISKYEKFTQLVRTMLPTVTHDKKLMAAMKNHSWADDATLKKGLMWGSGPLVNVAMLVPKEEGGKTITPTGGYRLKSNIIDVGIGDVGRYQTGQDVRTTARGHVPLVTIILLHEMVHWAREVSQTNETPGVEDGFEFEKEAYGKVIER
jgi:Metallopeptidase toxin 3